MQAIGIKASMEKVCSKFGRSKQGFYQHREYLKRRQRLLDEIIPAVKQIRVDQPSVGIRKLQFHLAERDIRVGRDRLSDILREHGLESKAYRRKCTTSTGSRSNYPNLLKTFGSAQRAGEILVSDITYLSTKKGFVYLSLTSDAYSNAILGYSLERNLGSQGPLTALDQALKALGPIKVGIHHSDHGTQYTSNAFQNVLFVNNILVSMTGKGKCYDNAKAERINGVLKHELYLDRNFEDYDEALLYVNHAIYIYNNERVILSKGMQRPFEILAKTAKHCG
jgi:transposase InsO family protein